MAVILGIAAGSDVAVGSAGLTTVAVRVGVLAVVTECRASSTSDVDCSQAARRRAVIMTRMMHAERVDGVLGGTILIADVLMIWRWV